MIDTRDPWGPYRTTIEDHLDTCTDYLNRLRRSLAGEIAPDRHYFADKAHQLYQAAHRLVRLGQDTERWLADCAAPIQERLDDGTSSFGECALPAGHTGDHRASPDQFLGERLCGAARKVADEAERISHRLGRHALAIDRQRARATSAMAEDRDALREMAVNLEEVARHATRLAGQLRSADLGHAEAPPDHCVRSITRRIPLPRTQRCRPVSESVLSHGFRRTLSTREGRRQP